MEIIQTIADLRAALSAQRDITLVPTMGNLHDGHLSLVRMARQRTGLVVASIFVNQLQFAPHEDFAKYPRTLERDCELLSSGGCDIVFAPSGQEMYPEPQRYSIHPPTELADILEGAFRPGFFLGVCIVVLKLFNIVQPKAAVFGKKDRQQLLIIKSMAQQLALPIEIIPAETVREKSGLALSSRNGYLNEPQLAEAAHLNRVLRQVAGDVNSGRTDWAALERDAMACLQQRGWLPDYVAIRRTADLGKAVAGEPFVVLGAAKLGPTRLIDNVDGLTI
ncbi:MAG: pantoate--beta-alanine ligase [Gammaproteobacteria bacterium]|jgi:pantoate--beta-alanine ligase|nr:pantoate--beta-alanine ligase [Gammaproteobacteria bacterium]